MQQSDSGNQATFRLNVNNFSSKPSGGLSNDVDAEDGRYTDANRASKVHVHAPPKRIPFKFVAFTFGGFAVLMALLNLSINIMAVHPGRHLAMQLDENAHDQVFGPHGSEDDVGANFDGRFAVNQNQFVASSRDLWKSQQEHDLTQVPSDSLQLENVLPLLRNNHNKPKQRVCTGLCPSPLSVTDVAKRKRQSDFVEDLVKGRFASLQPLFHWSIDAPVDTKLESQSDSCREEHDKPEALQHEKYKEIWLQARLWLSEREIYPAGQNYSIVLTALREAKVLRAEVPKLGTQLKPQRYARAEVIVGTPYAGFDRHNSEIVAFHLAELLGFRRVPFVAGRRLHVHDEILSVADKALGATFVSAADKQTGNEQSALTCFYGKCYYCNPLEPVCANSSTGLIEGAVILWLGQLIGGNAGGGDLFRLRSPWARTYNDEKPAVWEIDYNFCTKIQANPTFGEAPVFLDLMDTAVFDFLIGNADRHRLEFINSTHYPLLLLLDNGKSFGNPFHDEISILAPLYQCCKLRKSTAAVLKAFGDPNVPSLSIALSKKLSGDCLSPLLTTDHLVALQRRLFKVLVVIQLCVDKYTEANVLLDDGFM